MMMEKQLGAGAASSWEQQQLNLPRLQTKQKQKQKQQQQQVVDSSQSLDQPDLEPLTPIGSMFLNPEMEFYGFCVIGFQNLVDLEELKQTLRNTLLKQKYFSSIVVRMSSGFPKFQKLKITVVVLGCSSSSSSGLQLLLLFLLSQVSHRHNTRVVVVVVVVAEEE
jgi:p-aminobenzoyl-glutamate transporter AbgT